VIAVMGETPTSPVTRESPVLVTAEAARIAKVEAEPKFGGEVGHITIGEFEGTKEIEGELLSEIEGELLCEKVYVFEGELLCERITVFEGELLCDRVKVFEGELLCERIKVFEGELLCERVKVFELLCDRV